MQMLNAVTSAQANPLTFSAAPSAAVGGGAPLPGLAGGQRPGAFGLAQSSSPGGFPQAGSAASTGNTIFSRIAGLFGHNSGSAPAAFVARGADVFQFQPGQNLFGQVVEQDPQSGMATLRFGSATLQTKDPALVVGQKLNVTVTGRQENTVTLQANSTPFASLTSENVNQALTQTLVKLNLPMSEGNFMLANSLAEHGLPLDRPTFEGMQKALAQMPATSNPAVFNARVGAALFLQNSQLPVSAQNLTVLSNFIAANPQVAQQLFSLQGEVKRILNSPSSLSTQGVEALSKVPGLLSEMILEPGGNVKGSGQAGQSASAGGTSKALFSAAKQAGIETHLALTGGTEPDWELAALMREFHQMLESNSSNSPLAALYQSWQNYQDNLAAQRLINQGKPDSSLGFYYLQIPLRYEFGESAEVWIRYRWKEETGRRVVDPEDTRLEFSVRTDSLGEMFFTLDVVGDVVHLTVKLEDEASLDYLENYLPALQERIQGLGWTTGSFLADLCDNALPFEHELAGCQDLADLETLDVQA